MTVTNQVPRRLAGARRLTAFTGLVLLTAAAGCGPSPVNSSSAASASGTKIVLTNFQVSNIPETVAAGKLTVSVANKGVGEHELLVFKSDLAPAQYPADSFGKVLEEDPSITKISDGGNIKAGQSQQRTIDLTVPGKYLFFCNLPGHFKLGMYRTVTVL